MRHFLFAALIVALAACNQAAPPADESAHEPAPLEQDLITGAIIAVGEGWRFDADPGAQRSTLTLEDGETFTAAYQSPAQVGTGYGLAGDGLTLTLETAPCNVLGVDYPMRAVAQARGHEALNGCAVVRWDAQLVRRMPQIDACLERSPQTRRITYVGDDGGGVLVRMSGESGAFDCHYQDGEARVAARNDTIRRASEGDAIFVRALPGADPGPQPGGECFTAPEVRGEDGALLGWMDDPLGC